MKKQKHYENNRLTNANREKSVFGVCAGIAEYFDIDVTIVRLLFVLLTLAGGPGLLLYIVLAIVLPSDNRIEDEWV